jgi:hypothetical protein
MQVKEAKPKPIEMTDRLWRLAYQQVNERAAETSKVIAMQIDRDGGHYDTIIKKWIPKGA